MYLSTLAFLAGIMTLPFWTHIPNLLWFLPALCITALVWWRFNTRLPKTISQCLFIAILGCLFILWRSEQLLQWQLPTDWEGKTITVTGMVDSLPKIDDGNIQFELLTQTINYLPQHTRLQLSWYNAATANPPTVLHAGETWQLQVRLKRPHSLLNPGGFDYEQWLFARGIRATGYIVNNVANTRLAQQAWRYPIDNVRERLQKKIQNTIAGEPTIGLITALIMGAQNDITQPQWQVMRATGTNHLMAIAGVHIAFMTGFVYAIVNFLWRRSRHLPLYLPTHQAAACASLIAAIIYSALAGFALPTQRALIMLVVFMLGLFTRRTLNPWNALALALLIILIHDPLATLSVSFWLSFGAVFAIIYGITGRLKPTGLWWKYGRVQWVITIALIPISLTLFNQTSLISLVANLIAVPAVGLLVLPFCLIGALLLVLCPPLAHWMLLLAAKIIAVIWMVLAWLGNLDMAVWQQSIPNGWILAATAIGVLLLIAPHGLPARWLGFVWLSPLLFYQPPKPALGTANVSLLEVGQGLSTVVQTAHHTLLFDTGPPMGKHDDAGQRVILPFLATSGIKKLDTMVISHGDSDHSGGAVSILKQMPVSTILTSVPERFATNNAQLCHDQITWQWDGVTFRMLYPMLELLGQGNNSSCILQVSTQHGTLLLTGDIEKPAEIYLLEHSPDLLPATVLVAPHHGSITSSTDAFVRAVHARYVLFSTGYKNRYHFPSDIVVARYRQDGAQPFNTADDGAVMLQLGGEQPDGVAVKTQREVDKKVWHK
jgi:competence protein ComEC